MSRFALRSPRLAQGHPSPYEQVRITLVFIAATGAVALVVTELGAIAGE